MPTKRERQVIDRVIRARTESGLERRDLADALVIDVNSYGHYERYRYAFTVDQIFTLSQKLGRSVEWLLGLDTALSAEEDRLLATWRGLSPTARGLATSMLQAMAEQERKETHG